MSLVDLGSGSGEDFAGRAFMTPPRLPIKNNDDDDSYGTPDPMPSGSVHEPDLTPLRFGRPGPPFGTIRERSSPAQRTPQHAAPAGHGPAQPLPQPAAPVGPAPAAHPWVQPITQRTPLAGAAPAGPALAGPALPGPALPGPAPAGPQLPQHGPAPALPEQPAPPVIVGEIRDDYYNMRNNDLIDRYDAGNLTDYNFYALREPVNAPAVGPGVDRAAMRPIINMADMMTVALTAAQVNLNSVMADMRTAISATRLAAAAGDATAHSAYQSAPALEDRRAILGERLRWIQAQEVTVSHLLQDEQQNLAELPGEGLPQVAVDVYSLNVILQMAQYGLDRGLQGGNIDYMATMADTLRRPPAIPVAWTHETTTRLQQARRLRRAREERERGEDRGEGSSTGRRV